MGTRLLEEPKENLDDENFKNFDANPDLGLREELGSLLSDLRARHNRVMKGHHCSVPGLLLNMEILIYNNLIFQLDHELTQHRSDVSEFIDIASKWTDRWSKKKD